MVVESGSAEETEALAARVAGVLRRGDVVSVAGALGVTQPVNSPTFTIGHRYDGRVPVAHLDLYRVLHVDPEEWAGLEPYFDGTIAFVEWPEHAGNWLPAVRARVTLEHVDELHRRVTIDSDDNLGL